MSSDDEKLKNHIHGDNQRANNVASGYIEAVNMQLLMHSAILSVAMEKYATFLGLKAIPPWYENFAGPAFAALSFVAPELFLVKFLGESEKTVAAALAVSSALGNKTAKVLEAAQRAKEIAKKAKEAGEKIKGAAETASQIKEKVSQITERNKAGPGVGQLGQFDAGRAAVQALGDSGARAYTIWQQALNVLADEYERRLDDPKHPGGESLEQLATRLLPHPEPLRAEQIEEIETKYLYEIIKEYVGKCVTVKTNIIASDWGTQSEAKSIENLNNNQQETIIEYFDWRAKRGKIFYDPPVVNIYGQLKVWGAKETSNVTHYAGRGLR